MAKLVGRTVNRSDEASLSGPITLNATTPVKIADKNENRIAFIVSNPSLVSSVWIRYKPANKNGPENKGFLVAKGGTAKMDPDNVYIGEISAIADIDSPVIYVTEY